MLVPGMNPGKKATIMFTKRSWLQLVAAIPIAAGFIAIFERPGSSESKDLQTVRLNVQPLSVAADPGPTSLIGGESQPGGYKFVWADVIVEGAGDCRVYFDFQDKDHFHFLDRKGSEAVLGMREAGVEQIFAKGALSGTAELRLARHGCKMGVFQGGALAAFAFDDRILEGGVGYRMLNGGSPVKVRAEARDDIHFAEDFMISQGKSEQWHGNGDAKRGDFEVKSLRHPLLSANAFSFFGAGSNIYSVTGESWWDNYVYELSLRGPETGKIGLVFAYRDENNYGLFRWGSRGKDGRWEARRELVRVRDGQEEVLAQAPGGYAPNEWYKATVNVSYARVSVYIDKHLMLETTDACLAAGAAGVWCDVPRPEKLAKDPKEQEFSLNSLEGLMRQHAVFDDVRVRSQEDYEERFLTPGTLKSGWLVGEGDWSVAANASADKAAAGHAPSALKSGTLSVRCAGDTKALIGDRRWSQYQVTADVQPLNKGVAGIVLMHRDESNYYVVKIENGILKLVRVAAGVERVEDNAQLTNAGAEPIRIQASVKKGHIRAIADDGASVEAFDGETRLRGRAGLYVHSGGSASVPSAAFSSFRIEFIPEPEPLVTNNAIFDEEVSMNEWSNSAAEWVPPSDNNIEVQDNKVVTLLWHRSQFPGDVELMVEPREITESNYMIALSCSKDGLTKNNGYVYRYTVGDEKSGKPGVHVEILRQGELVMEKQIGDDVRQLSNLAIRRCGKYIVGLVNGKAVLSFRDNDPLKGSKVAYKTQGILVKTEAMRIISDHFRNDTFSGAPVNWRLGGSAIAEVTNRWQCDPRWTFFSLQNERNVGKPAVLWSKQLYPGDVTVEFYFGNKMDHMRGNPYTYARDVNVTIGSDGSDLTKGYTFSFGGNGNTTSYISRNGVIVKQFPARIPTTMDYHRHWFAFKAERQGNIMKFRVDHFFQAPGKGDGKIPPPEMVFEDSVPVSGDRIAIWTYEHGIMISKIRISGDNGEDTESPDFLPGPVKTVYDTPVENGR